MVRVPRSHRGGRRFEPAILYRTFCPVLEITGIGHFSMVYKVLYRRYLSIFVDIKRKNAIKKWPDSQRIHVLLRPSCPSFFTAIITFIDTRSRSAAFFGGLFLYKKRAHPKGCAPFPTAQSKIFRHCKPPLQKAP